MFLAIPIYLSIYLSKFVWEIFLHPQNNVGEAISQYLLILRLIHRCKMKF